MATMATQTTEVMVAETRAVMMDTTLMAVVIRPAVTDKDTDSLMEVAPDAAAEVSTEAMEVKELVKILCNQLSKSKSMRSRSLLRNVPLLRI